MTPQEAKVHYNYLVTLCIRREEAFGPLAFAFIKEHDLDRLGLTPEEQFNLYMATADAFAAEPKRYIHKLECLHKAQQVLPRTQFADPAITHHVVQEIQKTKAELEIYTEAMRAPKAEKPPRIHRLIVETDLPDYFLNIAQKRAAAYYQNKYRVPPEAKIAQHFSPAVRRFEPDNPVLQKEFPGACAPFMAVRTSPLHLMLPFDLKISRRPDDPLEAGLRIWYAKMGYSFPLRYEMGKLCSWYDDEVLDLSMDDPHLLFVSVSPVKEPELGTVNRPLPDGVPMEVGLPRAFLEGTHGLGSFIQIACNFKIWFDADAMSILIQGAPDLYEYGLQGGAGLLTRTYASENIRAYAPSASKPWQQGLCFNFVNMHLQLAPGTDTALVPYNTPIFSVIPTLPRPSYRFEDARVLEGQGEALSR
jgi:hypothetical protein